MPDTAHAAGIQPAQLLQYVDQRTAQLHKLASNWFARIALHPSSEEALRLTRQIDQVYTHCLALFEVGGLARMAQLVAEADRIDAVVNNTAQAISDLAFEGRLACIGTTRAAAAPLQA